MLRVTSQQRTVDCVCLTGGERRKRYLIDLALGFFVTILIFTEFPRQNSVDEVRVCTCKEGVANDGAQNIEVGVAFFLNVILATGGGVES